MFSRLTSLAPFLLSGDTTIRPSGGVFANSVRFTFTVTPTAVLGFTVAKLPVLTALWNALNEATVANESESVLVKSNDSTVYSKRGFVVVTPTLEAMTGSRMVLAFKGATASKSTDRSPVLMLKINATISPLVAPAATAPKSALNTS